MSKAKRNNDRYRNFCFTINNPTDDDKSKVAQLPASYTVYGEEIGEKSGTPHLQGYCELTKQTRFKKLKLLLPRAHIEKRRGTAEQAAKYCKKDGVYTETGTISNPGKRNDISNLYDAMKEGKSNYELQEIDCSTYARYYKAMGHMRFNWQSATQKDYQHVEVIILHGTAGSGKTRACLEFDPDLYQVTRDGDWWCGYNGQSTILFDDYYGNIKYDRFLRLLDGYRFMLSVKGSQTWKNWTTVLITSNTAPHQWYTQGLTPALARRFTLVIDMDEEE